jgi:hypothetical protein
MKKLINHVDTVLAESLDGFAVAHADIVALGAEREFVRRLRPRTAARRIRRPRHARCRLPGAGLHLADAEPDAGRG